MKPSKPAKLPIILGGVAVTIFAVITQELRANQGAVTVAPTVTHSATPTTSEPVVCPHPTQTPITPMGSPDPECVYRQGTIGSQIRIDYNDLYHSTRKQLRHDGFSLQGTEAELYRLDLEILGRAMSGGRQVQGT